MDIVLVVHSKQFRKNLEKALTDLQPSVIVEYTADSIRMRPEEPEYMQCLAELMRDKTNLSQTFEQYDLVIELLFKLIESTEKPKILATPYQILIFLANAMDPDRQNDYEQIAEEIGLELEQNMFMTILCFYLAIMPLMIKSISRLGAGNVLDFYYLVTKQKDIATIEI